MKRKRGLPVLPVLPDPLITTHGMGMVALGSWVTRHHHNIGDEWLTTLQMWRGLRLASTWTGGLIVTGTVEDAVRGFADAWERTVPYIRGLMAVDVWMRVGDFARHEPPAVDVTLLAQISRIICRTGRLRILAALKAPGQPSAQMMKRVRHYSGDQSVYKRLRKSLNHALGTVEARLPAAIKWADCPTVKTAWLRVWANLVRAHPLQVTPDSDPTRLDTWEQLDHRAGAAPLVRQMLESVADVGDPHQLLRVESIFHRVVGKWPGQEEFKTLAS